MARHHDPRAAEDALEYLAPTNSSSPSSKKGNAGAQDTRCISIMSLYSGIVSLSTFLAIDLPFWSILGAEVADGLKCRCTYTFRCCVDRGPLRAVVRDSKINAVLGRYGCKMLLTRPTLVVIHPVRDTHVGHTASDSRLLPLAQRS